MSEINRVAYSVAEVAKMMGIGRNLAYQLVQDGEIESIRIGEKRIVIPKVSLDRFIKGKRRGKMPRLILEVD